MPVDQPPQGPRRDGALGALTDLSARLVSVLPPAMVTLIVLNLAFLTLIFWWLDRQAEQRMELISKVVERCLH